MADGPKVITAEELDAMSPDERARVVREHIVTHMEQLPDGFRRRIETTVDSVDPAASRHRVSGRRQVRVAPSFFDRLDELFPEERSPTGVPSTADFLLHEMPPLIDLLALDYEAATLEVRDAPGAPSPSRRPACLSLM